MVSKKKTKKKTKKKQKKNPEKYLSCHLITFSISISLFLFIFKTLSVFNKDLTHYNNETFWTSIYLVLECLNTVVAELIRI